MTTRLLSFLIWALVAASVVFWGNRFLASPLPVPAHAATVATSAVLAAGPLSRLFGSAPVTAVATLDAAQAPPSDGRIKLLGVAAPRSGQTGGWALLVVDDKPARTFGLGSRVDSGLVVQSISHRQVDLGPPRGRPTMSLVLPPVAEATRGQPGAVERVPSAAAAAATAAGPIFGRTAPAGQMPAGQPFATPQVMPGPTMIAPMPPGAQPPEPGQPGSAFPQR